MGDLVHLSPLVANYRWHMHSSHLLARCRFIVFRVWFKCTYYAFHDDMSLHPGVSLSDFHIRGRCLLLGEKQYYCSPNTLNLSVCEKCHWCSLSFSYNNTPYWQIKIVKLHCTCSWERATQDYLCNVNGGWIGPKKEV